VIDLFYFSGLPVAVLGLGRSGLAAARALKQAGAEVWAWDDNEDRRTAAAKEGIPLVDLMGCNWQELTSLVISPGIPHLHPEPHPVAALARQHNCEIIGDIELLGRAMRNASYIGVTGTNGKSTTTALIGHVLESAGREAQVGGNLGPPALLLEPLDQGGFYVLEMSSFQLELTLSITFDVAVLLNVSRDHLERHGGLDGYIAAKRLIFHRQTAPRTAVVGIDDEICQRVCRELSDAGEQIVVPISGLGRAAGGVSCRAATTGRTPRPPSPPARRPASSRRSSPPACAAIPACRTARSYSPWSTASPTSTTPRRPTRTLPPRRWPATTRSTGSPAAGPRPATSRPSRSCSRGSPTPS
jgi:UDP-N-acetylmuramoylalanine--D-glutamate ligase